MTVQYRALNECHYPRCEEPATTEVFYGDNLYIHRVCDRHLRWGKDVVTAIAAEAGET